jgi:hypothetical protein
LDADVDFHRWSLAPRLSIVAFDERYRNINVRAFINTEELIGAPQNPRRLTFGVDLRLP